MKSDESPAEFFTRLDGLAFHCQDSFDDIRMHFYRGLSEAIQSAIGIPDTSWDLQTLVTKCTFAHRLAAQKTTTAKAIAKAEGNLNTMSADSFSAAFKEHATRLATASVDARSPS
jgi:hypothetical protein